MDATAELGIVDSHTKPDHAVAAVSEVRDAVGTQVAIGIDFHGRVRKPMAKSLIAELAPMRPTFIEEPLLPENLDNLAEVVHGSPVPIALGERLYTRWDFKAMFEARCVDIVQRDLSHTGGISECRKIATMAEAYDAALAPHCPFGPIALAASLQIDAVSHNAFIQEQSLCIHYTTGSDLLDHLVDPLGLQLCRRPCRDPPRLRASGSRSMRTRCGVRPKPAIAGASLCGASPTALLPSGEPANIARVVSLDQTLGLCRKMRPELHPLINASFSWRRSVHSPGPPAGAIP